MGHAGTDFEIEWRSIEELVAVEAGDPLLRSAAIALESGLLGKDELLARYEMVRAKCFAAADEADRRPKPRSAGRDRRAAGPLTRKVQAGSRAQRLFRQAT